MFIYRSKIFVGAIFFQLVILYNIIINFILNIQIIPIASLLLLLSIIFNVASLITFNHKYMSIGLVLNILFIPFSSIFSIFVIPSTIFLIVGYIRQQHKFNLFEAHKKIDKKYNIEDEGDSNYGQ